MCELFHIVWPAHGCERDGDSRTKCAMQNTQKKIRAVLLLLHFHSTRGRAKGTTRCGASETAVRQPAIKRNGRTSHEKHELYARLKRIWSHECVCVCLCVSCECAQHIAARSTVQYQRECSTGRVYAVGSNRYTSECCVIDFYECVKNVCSDKNPPLNALKRDRDAFNVVIHQYINVFIYLDAARTVGSDILMTRCAIYCASIY